jgi:hypothetical protein
MDTQDKLQERLVRQGLRLRDMQSELDKYKQLVGKEIELNEKVKLLEKEKLSLQLRVNKLESNIERYIDNISTSLLKR